MPLLNKTKISIKGGSPGTYTVLPACFELPDFGVDPELVDTTTLDDSVMTSEQGVGDPGSLEFQFRYRQGPAEAYAVLDGLRSTADLMMKAEFPAGVTVEFPISGFTTKLTGGGINNPLNFTLSVSLSGDFEITTASA